MEAPNSNFYTCAELNVITDKGNSCDHSPVISCVETATISSGYQSLGVCRRTSPKIKSPYADYDDYKKDMPQCVDKAYESSFAVFKTADDNDTYSDVITSVYSEMVSQLTTILNSTIIYCI